jgi:adenosine deaminase
MISEDVFSLQKGELHVHLNGLVSPILVRTLLTEENIQIPHGFNQLTDLVRDTPCPSLVDYLKPWQVLRRIPNSKMNLKRLSDDAFESLAHNNVKFVELRSSVIYLTTLLNCTVHEALALLIETIRESSEKYNIATGLILTVTRGDNSSIQLATLLTAYRDLGCPKAVVGIDLAGDEEVPIPSELPSLFKSAKDRYGLGITIHAGETGRSENILAAINDFGADRIGHGTAAGSNPDVMDILRKRDICVEVCPISNRLTGAVEKINMHPLLEFYRSGVPFVICSDNPGIHQKGLNEDYIAALKEGIDLNALRFQFALATKYSFLVLSDEN